MTTTIRLRIAIFFFAIIFAIGVLGFKNFATEEITWMDSVYLTLITLTTIGSREAPLDQNGKIFAMGLIIVGIGIIAYVMTSFTAFIVEGNIRRMLGRKKMLKAMDKLEGHFIVCGAGETGVHVVEELLRTKRDFIVIDINEERLERIQKLGDNIMYLVGDASDDDLLLQAGINRAHGMVIALPTDKDNLFVTITARQLNKNLRIIAREIDPKAKRKLLQSGANAVVSPNLIGGLRMASELLRPSVVSFLDTMLRDTRAIRFEEIIIPPNSPLVGQSLRDANIQSKTALLIVAVKKHNECEFIYNPGPDLKIEPDMTLIVLGESANLSKLKSLISK